MALTTEQPGSGSLRTGEPAQPAVPLPDEFARRRLPSWPLTALIGFIPLWWLLGLIDLIWMPMAVIMGLLLARRGRVRAPRGFGLWMVFLVWMLFSAVEIDTPNHMIAFAYRASIYLSATVFFLYAFNFRLGGARALSAQRICGILTAYFFTAAAGGYLGLLQPNLVVRTPMYQLLLHFSQSIASNDFVNHMVVRRAAQYNPDSYLGVAARPSAPFLYANNWGNAYSLLVPFVIAYLISVRGRRRFWPILMVLAASVVPAALTLNRGMLIGLGVAGAYVAFRLALRGKTLPVVVIVVALVAGFTAFQVIAGSRLETRLEGSGTSTRASLYAQSFAAVPAKPIFGYGVPPQTDDPDQPPVGTQGQFWLLLVSSGPVSIAAFMGFFLVCFWRSRKRHDPIGLSAHTVLLSSVVELGFYGVVPYGLPIMVLAAALAVRPPDPILERVPVRSRRRPVVEVRS